MKLVALTLYYFTSFFGGGGQKSINESNSYLWWGIKHRNQTHQTNQTNHRQLENPSVAERIKTIGWTPKEARNKDETSILYIPTLPRSLHEVLVQLHASQGRFGKFWTQIVQREIWLLISFWWNGLFKRKRWWALWRSLVAIYELVWHKNQQHRNLCMDLKQVAGVRLSDFLTAHGFRDVHQPRSLGSCLQFRMHKVSGRRIFWTEESPWVR